VGVGGDEPEPVEPVDLTALPGSSQHRYDIVTDVAQISDGRVRLKAGILYVALAG
jgi:hypothetical protein